MENNEKLKALLSKDYMPIIYKNIKKYRKESGMSLSSRNIGYVPRLFKKN